MQTNKILFLLGLCLLGFSCKNEAIKTENKEPAKCKAEVAIPDESKYYITPAMGGIIKDIYVKNYDSVSCGQKMISMYNPEYFNIQKEFIALKYELDYLKEEFKRQGELSIENVTSLKKMQKAQADYFMKQAVCRSLEEKLHCIGFSPEYVFKNGPLKYAILQAPVNGILIINNISRGQHFDMTDKNIYILTDDSVYIKIFPDIESDLEITVGSVFSLYQGSKIISEAVVHSTNSIDEADGVFYKALLKDKDDRFIEGLKLSALLKK